MPNFNSKLSYLFTLKNAMLTVAKYVSLILCIYLIFKYKEYKIQWNLLTFFFPQVSSHLNELLSYCITIILLIPFTIILLSFLIPSNMALRIVSGFFAIMGTSISIIRGLLNDILGYAYNFGFLVITHIVATLEEKRQIFLLEFKRITAELCVNALEKKAFMEQFLTKTDFVIYDQKLNALESLDSVRKYTYEVCMDLNNKYANLHTKVPFQLTDYVSVKTIVISVAVIVVLLGTFYYFTEAPTLPQKYMEGVTRMSKDNAGATDQLHHTASTLETTASHIVKPTLDALEQASALAIKNTQDIKFLMSKIAVLEKVIVNLLNVTRDLAINDPEAQGTFSVLSHALVKAFPKTFVLANGVFSTIISK